MNYSINNKSDFSETLSREREKSFSSNCDRLSSMAKKIQEISFFSPTPGLFVYFTAPSNLLHCYKILQANGSYDTETKIEAIFRFIQSLLGLATAFIETYHIIETLSSLGFSWLLLQFSPLFITLALSVVLIEVLIQIYYLRQHANFAKIELFQQKNFLTKNPTEITLQDMKNCIQFLKPKSSSENVLFKKMQTIEKICANPFNNNVTERVKQFQFMAQQLLLTSFENLYLSHLQDKNTFQTAPTLTLSKRFYSCMVYPLSRIRKNICLDFSSSRKKPLPKTWENKREQAIQIIKKMEVQQKKKTHLCLMKILGKSLILATLLLALGLCPAFHFLALGLLVVGYCIDYTHCLIDWCYRENIKDFSSFISLLTTPIAKGIQKIKNICIDFFNDFSAPQRQERAIALKPLPSCSTPSCYTVKNSSSLLLHYPSPSKKQQKAI